jgi:DNA repair photolyase
MAENNTITVNFGYNNVKEYPIINDVYPHYLVETKKEPHGWIYYDFLKSGKRECTHERLLINPYGGCGGIECVMCYTKALGSYYRTFWKNKVVAVCKDYDQVIDKYLSRLYSASCGYLSPTTDPFQNLETKYFLSEKIIDTFTKYDLPIESITKKASNIPDRVFKLIELQSYKHSFTQFTILTPDNEILKKLSPGGDTFDIQIKGISRAANHDIRNIVCRIDPIFPYLTDKKEDIGYIMEAAKNSGANHVIMSCVDIPKRIQSQLFDAIEDLTDIDNFKKLYKNDQIVSGDLNANMEYRNKLFSMGKDLATKNKLTFSLCMEFFKTKENGKIVYKGLNDKYMTSTACEGINTPIYFRNSLDETFKPFSAISECNGNCLNHAKNIPNNTCKGDCNNDMFRNARGLKLLHYRKLGKDEFKI